LTSALCNSSKYLFRPYSNTCHSSCNKAARQTDTLLSRPKAYVVPCSWYQ